MRRGRNPRRVYDENGREIAPPTLAHCRAQGETTAAVTCHGCQRHAVISTDRFPDDLPFPDIALRVYCSACGSREASVMMDMQAHTLGSRLRQVGGWWPGRSARCWIRMCGTQTQKSPPPGDRDGLKCMGRRSN